MQFIRFNRLQGVSPHPYKEQNFEHAGARMSSARHGATGIAYNFNDRLRIYKRPLPARKMKIHVPHGVNVVMGHTRMTTQGNAQFNQNNHPFLGKVDGNCFALAHNGVLWNDKELRMEENLPMTSVETDSYVAVQLLEQQKALDFDSLQAMAEKVEVLSFSRCSIRTIPSGSLSETIRFA